MNRAQVAGRAVYQGSPEHKDKRSWLGPPQPRRRGAKSPRGAANPKLTATICDLVSPADQAMATHWIQTAIQRGQFDPTDIRNGFPRYVWHRDATGRYWYGFLTNEGAGPNPIGSYKGWPISEEEWRARFR